MTVEELVAHIYGQKVKLQEAGLSPKQVILSMDNWREIWAWHLSRGLMEQAPHMDYIQENSIFNLEVLIDHTEEVLVR